MKKRPGADKATGPNLCVPQRTNKSKQHPWKSGELLSSNLLKASTLCSDINDLHRNGKKTGSFWNAKPSLKPRVSLEDIGTLEWEESEPAPSKPSARKAKTADPIATDVVLPGMPPPQEDEAAMGLRRQDALTFLSAYHLAAQGRDGQFILSSIEPSRQLGAKDKLLPFYFRIGKVEDMVAEAIARSRHQNIYFDQGLRSTDLSSN